MLSGIINQDATITSMLTIISFKSFIGIISGILTSASMLPQLIKLIKEKKSKDLSVVMLLVLLSGLAGWIYYGVLLKDYILIITNSFSFAVNLVTLILGIKYKSRK